MTKSTDPKPASPGADTDPEGPPRTGRERQRIVEEPTPLLSLLQSQPSGGRGTAQVENGVMKAVPAGAPGNQLIPAVFVPWQLEPS